MPPLSTTVRRAAKAGVRTVSSRAARARALDVTDSFGVGSCVVVAPHPDDETFGCGATIARWCHAGTDVRVVFVSGGGASPAPAGMIRADVVAMRRREAGAALAELGLAEDNVVHLDFDDGGMGGQVDAIAAALSEVFADVGATHVLVTSLRDRHPDHAAVATATRSAVAGQDGTLPLFEYPIWQRAPGLARTDGTGRTVLVRADQFLPAKRRAVGAYRSQLPHLPVGFVEDFLVGWETFTPVAP